MPRDRIYELKHTSRLGNLVEICCRYSQTKVNDVRRSLAWLIPLLFLDFFGSLAYYIWFTFRTVEEFDQTQLDLSAFVVPPERLTSFNKVYGFDRVAYSRKRAEIIKAKNKFINDARAAHNEEVESSLGNYLSLQEEEIFKIQNLLNLSQGEIRWKVCEISSLVAILILLIFFVFYETVPFSYNGRPCVFWCRSGRKSKASTYSRGCIYTFLSLVALYCKTDGGLYAKSLPFVRFIRLFLYVRILYLGQKYVGLYLRTIFAGHPLVDDGNGGNDLIEGIGLNNQDSREEDSTIINLDPREEPLPKGNTIESRATTLLFTGDQDRTDVIQESNSASNTSKPPAYNKV